MNERYYKLSGRLPIGGAILTLIAGVTSAALAGYFYGAVSYYSPIIILNLFGPVVVGFASVFVINKVGHLFKIRNSPFLIFTGIVSGLVAIYFSWAGYVFVLLVESNEMEFSLLSVFWILFSPFDIVQIIPEIAKNGVWEIKNFAPTGFMLYGIWLVEAGVILGINAVSVSDLSTPFCEDCNIWTQMHDDAPVLSKRPVDELKTHLEQENYKFLDEMLKEEANPANCFVTVFHNCPQCEESNYLTVSHVTMTENSKGEIETNAENIIQNISIPHSLVEIFTGKSKALRELRNQQLIDDMGMEAAQEENEEDEEPSEGEEFPEMK